MGSETAPKRASKAFIKPIAVAAKIGRLISRIMVKQSKKLLIEKPNKKSSSMIDVWVRPGA